MSGSAPGSLGAATVLDRLQRPVALGVAHLHAHPLGVDVGHRQRKPLAQTQAQAVEGEEEHPVAEHPGGAEQLLRFIDRDDVGQALRLRWLDQVRHGPGQFEHVLGEELQAIQIELDRAPRVGVDQVAEIRGQLRFGECVDAVVEIPAQAADRARVGVDGLGLQTFELQVFQVGVVLPGKVRREIGRHGGESSRNIAESIPPATKERTCRIIRCQQPGDISA